MAMLAAGPSQDFAAGGFAAGGRDIRDGSEALAALIEHMPETCLA